jgi:large subunit ribosomal protein L19
LIIIGSVLAVTSADPYAPNRRNRFVGICIQRERHGLKHQFTLRNIVDGLGKHLFSMNIGINIVEFL